MCALPPVDLGQSAHRLGLQSALLQSRFFLVSSRTGSLTLCLVRCFLRSQFPRGHRRLVRKLRFRCYPRIRLLPVTTPLASAPPLVTSESSVSATGDAAVVSDLESDKEEQNLDMVKRKRNQHKQFWSSSLSSNKMSPP
ncbi:Hypothetical predicted protein [Pelobates cultripes]|uniref:Uncharacterized protein n=1 Tax=Pelobates cultripes TaxID=61616 RepID=A0AAD1RJC9_PELCU|nr:Hypothetical predicted protein [Pelobates cultripes]